MQKVVNGYYKVILIFGTVAAAWLLWSAFGRQISRVVFRLPDFSIEDRTGPLHTSTKYRYDSKFQTTLERYSKFSKLYQEDISTAVPGLESTVFGDTASTQMVPQGLSIAGDYMLVTAYDNGGKFARENNYKGEYTVNRSVVYVLSNTDTSNRELLTTIILPDVNHVGGIAFDGEYVWIAKSTTRQCSAIDYDIIRQAAEAGQENYELSSYTAEADCGMTASFVTYYNERLWVGTYRSILSGKGSLCSFAVDDSDGTPKLVQEDMLTIPAFANGVVFAEVGGQTCMAVTSSCGRYLDSKIYLYEVDRNTSGLSLAPRGVYSFPPMAEEMTGDGEHTYFLFESAATCYSTMKYKKCSYPVDRICGVSTEELFFWSQDAKLGRSKEVGRLNALKVHYDLAYCDLEKHLKILKGLKDLRCGNKFLFGVI